VLITSRGVNVLETTAAVHATIVGLRADSADPNDAARTVAKVVELWGRLDVLVNNAGAGCILPLAQATANRITDIFAVNVLGPSLLTAAALPLLIESRGIVINISSTYGHRPIANLSHYAASKAALEHLTRCWALELAQQGVRVNGVAAGPTETGALTGMMGLTPQLAEDVKDDERQRIPLGRRGVPHDVARWVSALADPKADWITGQVITVDGGFELT
jgi:NAD(P)-dependent dehydrogenase (short-subunit alcohol dehydrogenase family)